jgi:CRP-like cAMP-binding protein
MALSEPLDPLRNRLLARLPKEIREDVLRLLRPAGMAARSQLQEAGEDIALVHFPLSGAVAVLQVVEQRPVHTGLVGREGVVGLAALLGPARAESRYVVQIEGDALVGDACAMRELAGRFPALRARAVSCLQAWSAELLATLACERAHSLRQRCCRLLLRLVDQSGENAFSLTHDGLAEMLGVRRATATVLVGALRREGWVTYRHGQFSVVDPVALARQACECHSRIRRASSRILGSAAV